MALVWSFFALLVFSAITCVPAVLVRKNVENLREEDILNLQKALGEVNADTSERGYAAIAAYHGYPASCKHHGRDVACCMHGEPVFPQWHRLYVVQLEQALKEKGLAIGIPYWDWTQPISELPSLVSHKVFMDTAGGRAKKNVWYQGDIQVDGKTIHTARAVDERLFQQVEAGEVTSLFDHILDALEYSEYSQFETQFEVAHNTIHYLVGGRNRYSMSHLDYTSYDPIFFLHHSNVDRIYAIYQALQRDRGKSNVAPLVDVKAFHRRLEPFSWDSNPFAITKSHSRPSDAEDYSIFGYRYDDLTLNGHDLEGIKRLLKERSGHDRAFAAFRLHGIGSSADVKVKVCVTSHDGVDGFCQSAGDFFILGGPLEMQWSFARPFYFEITNTVLSMGLKLTDNYKVAADLFSVNGTKLKSSILPPPYVSYRPAEGRRDERIELASGEDVDTRKDLAVRKDVDRLGREEMYELRQALAKFEKDRSIDGYQAIAEFHGDPGKCPFPTAKNRLACCIHGMPTFPHWHRLLVVQVEDALKHRGSTTGVPYWDWTKPNSGIPSLAVNESYVDPHTGETTHNPFYDAEIVFLGTGVRTARDPLDGLSQQPNFGDHTELFDAFIDALSYTDFCDFEHKHIRWVWLNDSNFGSQDQPDDAALSGEQKDQQRQTTEYPQYPQYPHPQYPQVQFEVAHNLIHGLVGGKAAYSLSTLSYSAFDPIFYLHHSNIDRIWAIWTALQQHRGKPFKAHCAQSYVYWPLKPFAFASPYNNDEKTASHAVPTHIYDYQTELGYAYDSLEFGGMGIVELEEYINANIRGKDRTFVGIQLHGIKKSAMAHVYITPAGGDRFDAGRFALLGGPTEMPWDYDRQYKHDITDALASMGLHYNDNFDISFEMNEFDGTVVDVSQFPRIHLIHEPKTVSDKVQASDVHVRKNVDQLNREEVLELRHAMSNLQEDKSHGAFQDLGRYHGTPKWCPAPDAEVKKSCCLHGMPTFPHWHRLWTVQAENALRRHGYQGAIPYWDWTKPMQHLPDLVSSVSYTDPSSGQDVANPFFSAHIDDVNNDTVRDVSDVLFQQPAFGEYTDIAKQVLLALEQDNFCDFEVHFEIAHNFIHALVGGNNRFSMASLMYTAFDPIFYLHHSNTDRIWATWQALQKYRGRPYNSANCAIAQLRKPLSPFSLSSDVNPDPVTRENSVPFQVFDYESHFHYEYDNLEFNGLTIPQLDRTLEQIKSHDRVFAGFMLHGIGQSALIKFYICKSADDCDHLGGEFYMLGDPNEMDWAYDRLYKYEITEQLAKLGLRYNDRYSLKYEVFDLSGHIISTDVFAKPTVVRKLGTSQLYGQEYREAVTTAAHVRKNLKSLNKGEVESLRSAFLAIVEDKTYEIIASFHGRPGLCEYEGRKMACCVHGMPTFPAWHRLYVEAVEEALLSHGSNVAVPYWDWLSPITSLPSLINKATYFNSRKQRFEPNPFFSGSIAGEDAVTTRDPQPELFNNDYFYDQALLVLEQDNFCDFEIQFEILHNALHSYLGGRSIYSMSSLDYSAFDPVFFLHHSATDRLWAIWQELQRYRGLPYNEADCAINLMRIPLHPFDNTSVNLDELTLRWSRPADTFDYRNHFLYEYDTLELHGLSIRQLEHLLKRRKENGRVFAGFLLHNIGMSAVVKINVCVPTGRQGQKNCHHRAGEFSILGGELEMPFTFDRLYKFEITNTLRDLGLKLDSAAAFDLSIDIRANNGSRLSSNILPKPSIIFEPGSDDTQQADGHVTPYVVRKEIDSLSPREKLSLVNAMRALQADHSPDGFQSIASFHALPPLCPSPAASKRYACCIHGMATFPQWHRLYTVQVEDALKRHGSLVGIPYWDWTRESDALPAFITETTYHDAYTDVDYDNPFNRARIEFEDVDVERDIQGEYLFKHGPHGWDTWLFNQVLYALEQEDYCDFEIQFEIAHNAIHSWIGGSEEHSMGHLHYASYDPIFFVHHSNTDRIWAIWQALQDYRGLDSKEAHCALEQMREPLRPFSFGEPYNLNPLTTQYSKPEDTFDYQAHFHYRYDQLEFVGMNIPKLDSFIKERQERDRVFAGFLLKGFGSSAKVNFDICDSSHHCFEAGYFTILGGSAEMPWQFDRLYKYEITDQLHDHGLHFDDDYKFRVHLKYIDGTDLDSSLIPTPSVLYEPARANDDIKSVAENSIRRDLTTLTERDIQSLKAALRDLQHDESNDGWAALASFHGAPVHCPDPENASLACCQHGMPTFPHWHRLFTLQVEQALHRHGSSIAIPYWDWTRSITELPSMFTREDFYDVWNDAVYANPFAHGYVSSENAYTVRDVQPELFEIYEDGEHSALLDLVLSALEQTDYCDFEVQFEVMHNAIHYLVGGHQTYSLSSLEYSAYDPIFFIHHSFVDKIWVVWQELQKRRHLPYNRADCAVNYMTEPMKPFTFQGFNLNKFTRDHAVPNTLFDHEVLGYVYDNLEIGGYDLEHLEYMIADKQSRPRVFAGFLLKGIKTSGSVAVYICEANQECSFAGRFNLLGGPTEEPWAFDRLFKLDITKALKNAGINPEDVFDAEAPFTLQTKVFDVEGTAISVKSVMPPPTVIFEPARVAAEDVVSTAVAGVGVRKDVSSLSEAEVENLREALRKVQADEGPNGFQNIASFHGNPADRCGSEDHRLACCIHGMANFPQWHRLYIKQWEDALTAQGAKIGIPYWDWTTAFTELPPLVTQEENNPFFSGAIYNGEHTTRAPREQLFNDPEFGSESFFYRQVLLAFEQTDYCDFEVQYEITHNAIHSWTGGTSPYGMSTLEYTAYDPLFLLHHSNVDRQFAIWQALQKYRGLPYNSANCAIQHLRQPMRPFSDEDNVNPVTRNNARATDAFDYDRFNYQYDNLNFHGHTIAELNAILESRKENDRIFAEFLLHGISTSADVVFRLCPAAGECAFAGTFAVLGGPTEMPWAFDRLFRYDVTGVFRSLNLRPDDAYHFEVETIAVSGEPAGESVKPPSVQFVPGVKKFYKRVAGKTVVRKDKLQRKDVNHLSLAETEELRNALHTLQQDQGPNGFEAIASFHGAPFLCPETATDKFACCVHGMAVFPHWHRLFTVQFEQALKANGASVGIPYWDWTARVSTLPDLFGDDSHNNPFYSYTISFNQHKTTRDIQEELFNPYKIGSQNHLYQLTLDTLEEDNYCDFEVQFEILHNEVHALIGGNGTYSMATLDFSAFDPFFMIHHSSIDRIWVIWQELQKLRHKPFNYAKCAGHIMEEPLHPFNYVSINKNELTRANAEPSLVFDHGHFGYEFDHLDLDGHGVEELNDIINSHKSQSRIYLAGVARGFRESLSTEFALLGDDGKVYRAGRTYLLGGEKEMPWAYERLWKFDITDVIREAGVDIDKPVKFHFNSKKYNGEPITGPGNSNQFTDYVMIYERPANTDYGILTIPLGRKNHLPPKVVVKKGTRVRFIAVSDKFNDDVEDLGSYTNMDACNIPPFTYNAFHLDLVHSLRPGEHYFVSRNVKACKAGLRIQVKVEDE